MPTSLKWGARVTLATTAGEKTKHVHIGVFENEIEAAKAVDIAALEFKGSKAKLKVTTVRSEKINIDRKTSFVRASKIRSFHTIATMLDR